MALPADIRNEILNEQKRNRKQQWPQAPVVDKMEPPVGQLAGNDDGAGCSHWGQQVLK